MASWSIYNSEIDICAIDYNFPFRSRRRRMNINRQGSLREQAICVCAIIDVGPLLYNNKLIKLLDEVRIKSKIDKTNLEDEMISIIEDKMIYYKPEYTRCISAFLKPYEDGKATCTKEWVRNEKFELLQTSVKSCKDLSVTEGIKRVVAVCLDDKQMSEEKAQADECSFGTRWAIIVDELMQHDTSKLRAVVHQIEWYFFLFYANHCNFRKATHQKFSTNKNKYNSTIANPKTFPKFIIFQY